MTVALEPALAALAGSAIGGLTTLAVTLMTQRVQARAALTTRDLTVRQKLYRKFIEEASKLYGDALMHSAVDIPMLIGTSALVNRMRVISTSGIVDKAEVVLRTIVDIYFSPNKTIAELREEINRDKLDLLSDFSSAAREELSARHVICCHSRLLCDHLHRLSPLNSNGCAPTLVGRARARTRGIRQGGRPRRFSARIRRRRQRDCPPSEPVPPARIAATCLGGASKHLLPS